ncbi:NAD(+)/NADH kinase [Burkholderia multivorans]|uniref:NAD(+)/NADH kinase n=1 Tax=Burkholderia multivorans TaxID=87883 RepID=UPI001C26EF0F|nr:NAD(+)/NADH kinase [Burkholderia multivorans]
MTTPVTVGVIANPASGRDIRRLTTHASVFPTAEKANMIVRLLAGLGAMGVERVLTLRDRTGIATLLLRALDTHRAVGADARWPDVEFVDLPITDTVADTHAGAAYLHRHEVALIVVLGGDGTHRAVAAHCGTTPLVALSTGTNNAFPEQREATVAGVAAGLAATGAVPPDVAFTRNKRLVVRCVAGPQPGREEIALVDVCAARQRERSAPHGLAMRFAGEGKTAGTPLVAPIAPGRVDRVVMRSCERLEPDVWQPIPFEHGTLAFDGEREIEVARGDRYEIALDWRGPLTVDVGRTLRYAASRQLLRDVSAWRN